MHGLSGCRHGISESRCVTRLGVWNVAGLWQRGPRADDVDRCAVDVLPAAQVSGLGMDRVGRSRSSTGFAACHASDAGARATRARTRGSRRSADASGIPGAPRFSATAPAAGTAGTAGSPASELPHATSSVTSAMTRTFLDVRIAHQFPLSLHAAHANWFHLRASPSRGSAEVFEDWARGSGNIGSLERSRPAAARTIH